MIQNHKLIVNDNATDSQLQTDDNVLYLSFGDCFWFLTGYLAYRFDYG